MFRELAGYLWGDSAHSHTNITEMLKWSFAMLHTCLFFSIFRGQIEYQQHRINDVKQVPITFLIEFLSWLTNVDPNHAALRSTKAIPDHARRLTANEKQSMTL